MDFGRLFESISPVLKRIAKNHNGHGLYIDEDDLYQEMCIYLWDGYKDGMPDGINEAYAIKGCEFHLLNYLRKKREKIEKMSLDQTINEEGYTLKDVIAHKGEPLNWSLDKDMVIQEVFNNGFTPREKEVFSLLLRGYTVREAGEELGVSHVMVLKYKQRIIKKWQKKKNKRLPRRAYFYFSKVEKTR